MGFKTATKIFKEGGLQLVAGLNLDLGITAIYSVLIGLYS